ncbi:MAG: hypothetical protein KDA25_00230, partial [Phycisphaerales bacterium]|nr:hypothetical protein [Phycisphaerales bacterium]
MTATRPRGVLGAILVIGCIVGIAVATPTPSASRAGRAELAVLRAAARWDDVDVFVLLRFGAHPDTTVRERARDLLDRRCDEVPPDFVRNCL